MPQYGSVPIATEDAIIQVSTDGNTWLTLTGVGGVSESGGEAPTRDNVTFQTVKQFVGKSRAPTIEVSIPAFIPGTSVYNTLQQAYQNGTLIHIRYGFKETTLFTASSPATVAIAIDGTVTLAGSNAVHPDFTTSDYGPGVAFKTGTSPNFVYDVVDTISATGTAKCKPRSAALAAVVYSVVIPPLYRPGYSARISSFDVVSAEAESEVSTTLSLAAFGQLPAWGIKDLSV